MTPRQPDDPPLRIEPGARREALHHLLDRLLDARPELEAGVDRFLRAAAGEMTQAETVEAMNAVVMGRDLVNAVGDFFRMAHRLSLDKPAPGSGA